LICAVLGAGCDRSAEEELKESSQEQPIENSAALAQVDDEAPGSERVPTTIDEALNLMMEGLTEKDRTFIENAGDDDATVAHFGGGMGMRNSWGLWGDSPLSRSFSRLGIYHADDMSAIINEAFSRRVRGKDIELDELVQYYRDYWEEEDIIAPLDLGCPHCAREMVIGYMGEDVSKPHPERVYFSGTCPDEQEFLFYHKDGWQQAETVNSEQSGADQPATAVESKAEGSEKLKPESEVRLQ